MYLAGLIAKYLYFYKTPEDAISWLTAKDNSSYMISLINGDYDYPQQRVNAFFKIRRAGTSNALFLRMSLKKLPDTLFYTVVKGLQSTGKIQILEKHFYEQFGQKLEITVKVISDPAALKPFLEENESELNPDQLEIMKKLLNRMI
jgi:hypothetical protein